MSLFRENRIMYVYRPYPYYLQNRQSHAGRRDFRLQNRECFQLRQINSISSS